MDPLADALSSIRLTGGVFLDARFRAPWSVLSHIDPEDCRPFLRRPVQLIGYHVVIAGRMTVEIDGEHSIEASAGEIVLLPGNSRHRLGSGHAVEPLDGHALIQPGANGSLARIDHGGTGEATHIVCGFLGSEDEPSPLISALPKVLKLAIAEAASRDLVEASVRFAASELAAGRIGSSSVMSRLSEMLLVEAVRHYMAMLGDGQRTSLNGFEDPQIGRALALLHGQISAPWTAGTLAKEAGMSRSAFVERFTALVGAPPIRYLTRLRLHTARLRLCETRQSIAQVARSVGYDSEEAFGRAFKRWFGTPPGRYREERSARR